MTANVFYTYVYGSDPIAGPPLIFGSKRDRTLAIKSSKEGDYVLGIASNKPSDTSVIIPEETKGRVLNAW